MSDTKKRLLVAAASVVKEFDSGKGVSAKAVNELRGAVIAEAPHCTPEQIANGECPTA